MTKSLIRERTFAFAAVSIARKSALLTRAKKV